MEPILRTIKIQGPIWEAKAIVLALETPTLSRSWRSLFISTQPRRITNQNRVFAPGTILALTYVTQVKIFQKAENTNLTHTWSRKGISVRQQLTSEEIQEKVKARDFSLLVLSSDPNMWKTADEDPVFKLLAGDIWLNNLNPQSRAAEKLYESLDLDMPSEGQNSPFGDLSVHPSGLSIYGNAKLPWEDGTFAGYYQLSPIVLGSSTIIDSYKLSPEVVRFQEEERVKFVSAWGRLSSYLTPNNPLNTVASLSSESQPVWVTLEISDPSNIPTMYWEIANWETNPVNYPLAFEQGEFSLFFSDQSLYNQSFPPTSLASTLPNQLIMNRDGETLSIEVSAFEPSLEMEPTDALKQQNYMQYFGENSASTEESQSAWQETVTLLNTNLALDPISTSQIVRQSQNRPSPVWEIDSPINEPLLWGFMPLADGWAQIPVPNLTEQIYVQADVANFDFNQAKNEERILKGAVSFGNGQLNSLQMEPDAHLWDLTIVNISRADGTFKLKAENNGFALQSISLDIYRPEVIIDGLFWLSTETPTTADAVPSLQNWSDGLRSIPIRTYQEQTEIFPPMMICEFDSLTFKSETAEDSPTAADLQKFQFKYSIDSKTLESFEKKKLFDLPLLQNDMPLIWRHHPSLPMVQNLPLTQTLDPPNFPSTSRQLMPFEPVSFDAWLFGVEENGSKDWLHFVGDATPPKALMALHDIALASLSLPGLYLDPSLQNGDGVDFNDGLPLLGQYRYDTPYTDEINAFAEVPEPESDSETQSVTLEPVAPEPPKPLDRKSFGKYWATLAEKANLAALDAVAAFYLADGRLNIAHLVEPNLWPIQFDSELDQYPGQLSLIDANSDHSISLKEEDALKGISGAFQIEDDRNLHLVNDVSDSIEITSGSMKLAIQNGRFRDQRGLSRDATQLEENLLKTNVSFEKTLDETQEFVLTTTTQPVQLAVDETEWRLWFHNLPVAKEERLFSVDFVRSPQAQDNNDPEAFSRQFNFLNGYEWRLQENEGGQLPLMLCGLEFYPISLSKVEFSDNGMSVLEIEGRLQLPLDGVGELVELNNIVSLRFEHQPERSLLQLTEISLLTESVATDWPLAVTSAQEQSNQPRLEWRSITYKPAQAGEVAQIEIDNCHLWFVLFDTVWTVVLPQIIFKKGISLIDAEFEFPKTPNSPIQPDKLNLSLDIESKKYEADIQVNIFIGNVDRPVINGTLAYDLLSDNPNSASLKALELFQFLTVDLFESHSHSSGIQIAWERTIPSQEELYVLPGMMLKQIKNTGMEKFETNSPGFLAFTFETVQVDDQSWPNLILSTSFTEVLLHCRWGQYLQKREGGSRDKQSLFGSSAGDLVIGYTTAWESDEQVWQDSFVINGIAEIINLISWPVAMSYDNENDKLRLPAAREGAQTPLNHYRHSLRILFNQHQLPTERLLSGKQKNIPGLLFTFIDDGSWQFLSVVEHQLAQIKQIAGEDGWEIVQEHRWTTLQEVRFLLPTSFIDFLSIRDRKIIDPVKGVQRKGILGGTFNEDFLTLWLEEESKEALSNLDASTLIVEASAPHWIKFSQTDSLIDNAQTTIQFLPVGIQRGILSQPEDYASNEFEEDQWLLFVTPFIGRLQFSSHDGIGQNLDDLMGVQVDPIYRLSHFKSENVENLPLQSLYLSHWRDTAHLDILVSPMDTAVGRTLDRLDPTTLEESWFRYQKQLPEGQGKYFQSVLTAYPDTPARMSRSISLKRAFDSHRPFYPPVLPDNYSLPAGIQEDMPVWRKEGTLIWQFASNDDTRGYSWYEIGLQIVTSQFFVDDEKQLKRHPAATLIPTHVDINEKDILPPLSLTVSPYMGLDFAPAKVQDVNSLPTLLTVLELLCLDPNSKQLKPIATQFRDERVSNLEAFAVNWAQSIRERLSPESQLAVVRFRQIKRVDTLSEDEAPIITDYRFKIIEPLLQSNGIQHHTIFRLRTTPKQLRYREGQFNDATPPNNKIELFELTPPQTNGVEPIHLQNRPSLKENALRQWPWGLSAIRYGVQYTKNKQGVLGKVGAPDNDFNLWWQAPHFQVQYRSALESDKPSAGLPELFRAPTINSLLPTLNSPSLPEIPDLLTQQSEDEDEDLLVPKPNWQPILPGAMNFLLLGERNGAMLALRNQLIRQAVSLDVDSPSEALLVSPSVTVQHRVPRPVPLPTNTNRDKALQTWGSYFEFEELLATGPNPFDEAFLIECGVHGPQRLKIELVEPPQGKISPSWDGKVLLKFKSDDSMQESDANQSQIGMDEWTIKLDYRDGFFNSSLNKVEILEGDDEPDEEVINFTSRDSFFDLDLTDGKLKLAITEETKKIVAAQSIGHVSFITIAAHHPSTPEGFYQYMHLPLQMGDENSQLPLSPTFVQFEDPEYNRQLATLAAHAPRILQIFEDDELTAYQVLLAADRKEYNVYSDMTIRYDWDDDRDQNILAPESVADNQPGIVQFKRIEQNGNKVKLYREVDNQKPIFLQPQEIFQINLTELVDPVSELKTRPALISGDRLQIELQVPVYDYESSLANVQTILRDEKIILELDIVADSVQPSPNAAYGLLRAKVSNQGKQIVDCGRFAWSPRPSRTELVCPEDLRKEVVRRRAVFQWNDVARNSKVKAYAIQKIASNGATHFPEFF